jgi:hypothetical protein
MKNNMKYNQNDIVLLYFRTVKGTETKVAIIQEKHHAGIIDKKHKYNYLVLMCGQTQPVWARGEEIVEKLYPVNNNQ